jgi:hypothetical protein
MGPIRCPETSVNNYHTMPCNIPEERSSQVVSRLRYVFLSSVLIKIQDKIIVLQVSTATQGICVTDLVKTSLQKK